MPRWIVTLAALLMFLFATVPVAAVTNGQPDDNGHPYVGLVFNDEGFCSGTLIAPTVFLTAGHCTWFFEVSGTPVVVTFDPYPSSQSTFYQAEAVYTHPSFCIACAPGLPGFDAYDVGVVILAEAVTDVGFGVLPEAGIAAELKGATLTAVGYGVQEFSVGGGPPQPSVAGTRFYAPQTVIETKSRVAAMFVKLSSNPAHGQGGTCFGDSGGPNFLDDQVTIVAITSFGTNAGCKGTGYAQRIDLPEVLNWLYESFPI
jgi:hypothetical protein